MRIFGGPQSAKKLCEVALAGVGATEPPGLEPPDGVIQGGRRDVELFRGGSNEGGRKRRADLRHVDAKGGGDEPDHHPVWFHSRYARQHQEVVPSDT